MVGQLQIGNKNFTLGTHTYVCGILNVTPDSFSDGGNYTSVESALKQAEQMLNEGAALIDIGGESTRPGYKQISEEEEINRVGEVIYRIRRELDPVISVDTYKYKVAQAAIEAGADMINDIWGLQYDEGQMAKVVAASGKACCFMHNRKESVYTQPFIEQVVCDLQKSVNIGAEAGIPLERMMVDPGVGFAKTYEQNLEVMNKLAAFKVLELPILLGASRKSVIGLTLDLPKEDRLEGSLATTAHAVMQGCDFVRVHDVKAHVRLIQMLEAIIGMNNK